MIEIYPCNHLCKSALYFLLEIPFRFLLSFAKYIIIWWEIFFS